MSGPLPQHMELELASHFECPVCFDYVLPPIHQCPEGHLLCVSCRHKLTSNTCPVCRRPLVGVAIRNLVLENIASDIYFPCKNLSKGCNWHLKWQDMESHQTICCSPPIKCPIPRYCPFEGSFDELVVHMKVNHGLLGRGGGGKLEWVIGASDFMLKEVDAEFYAQMMSCHGQHFLAIIRKVDVGVMFYELQYQGVVQMIGPPTKADGFTYRMEVDRGLRKCNWEGVTLPITEKVEGAFSTGDCFYIHPNTALLLEDEDRGLCINLSISKL